MVAFYMGWLKFLSVRVNSVTFDESLAGLFSIMSSLAFVVNFHSAHYYHACSGWA